MQELISKWIEALRSGEYNQVRYWLEKDGCYCATGVLGTIIKADIGTHTFLSDCKIDTELKSFLQSPVNILGEVMSIESHIIDMNDSGYSFNEIADWLENYLYSWKSLV